MKLFLLRSDKQTDSRQWNTAVDFEKSHHIKRAWHVAEIITPRAFIELKIVIKYSAFIS